MPFDALTPLRTEYRRYRRLIEVAVEQISDADLVRAPGGGANSIAVTLGHLIGNLRSRFTDFLTTDGEKPWRDRESEFDDPGSSRAELLARWEQAWTIVDGALEEVEAGAPGTLERSVTIRGVALTVPEALHRSVAHLAYHAGQIVLLARQAAGDAWVSPSIPRGQSEAYAHNPTRERGGM